MLHPKRRLAANAYLVLVDKGTVQGTMPGVMSKLQCRSTRDVGWWCRDFQITGAKLSRLGNQPGVKDIPRRREKRLERLERLEARRERLE